MDFNFTDPVKVPARRDFIPLDLSFTEKSVGETFNEIVNKYADNIAIIDSQQEITYRTLNQKSNRIAHAILTRNIKKESPIPFLLGRDVDAISTILGILKAGNIYTSLDPVNPLDYLQTILKDSQPEFIITNNAFLPLAHKVSNQILPILNLDELDPTLPDAEPGESPLPTSLAAIFYTSGTSGEPKGVVMDHRALIHRTWVHLNLHHLSPKDRSPLPFPFSFAWSITPLFSSLFSGGIGYPCNYGEMQLDQLADWLDKVLLTIIHISPSLFRQLLASLKKDSHRFRSVRLVNIGSDVLYPLDLDAWREHFPSDGIVAYGLASTELGTIARKFFNAKYKPLGNKLPVGYPVPSIKMHILDPDGNPVKQDEVGEIAVQSMSAIRGYWGKSGLEQQLSPSVNQGSAHEFRRTGDMGRLLPDGALEFHGRVDNMVKIRGYRVDTTEISSVLAGHPAVKDLYITVRSFPHAPEDKRLVAYIVPTEENKLTLKELRTYLASRLPVYKIPARFVFLDHLPRTTHGKVNVTALPEPPGKIEGTFLAPRNQEEELVARIWHDLLGLESVGIEDSFFELGGDSLSALNMTLEVEKQTGRSVSQDFFQQPTIARLVETLGPKGSRPYFQEGAPQKMVSAPTSVLKRFVDKRFKRRKQYKIFRVFKKDFWLDILILFTEVKIQRSILSRSYEEGNRWLLEWCRRQNITNGIFQTKYRSFCEILASLDGCTVDPVQGFQTSLFGNILRTLRPNSLQDVHTSGLLDRMRISKFLYWKDLRMLMDESPLSELDRHFSVSGLEYTEQAARQKHGVILVTYHGSLNRLAADFFTAPTWRRMDADHQSTSG